MAEKRVTIKVPKVYGGAGTAVIAQTLLSIIKTRSEGEALTRFIKMLYILPPDLRRRAFMAMDKADVPQHKVEEIKKAVENYDLSDREAEYILNEEKASRKLQAGLEAISEFLFYVLFIYGGEEMVERRVKARQ